MYVKLSLNLSFQVARNVYLGKFRFAIFKYNICTKFSNIYFTQFNFLKEYNKLSMVRANFNFQSQSENCYKLAQQLLRL